MTTDNDQNHATFPANAGDGDTASAVTPPEMLEFICAVSRLQRMIRWIAEANITDLRSGTTDVGVPREICHKIADGYQESLDTIEAVLEAYGMSRDTRCNGS